MRAVLVGTLRETCRGRWGATGSPRRTASPRCSVTGMTTEQLAIIAPAATALLLALLTFWYQRGLTKETLEHQANLTRQTLDHELALARDKGALDRKADTYVQMLEMFEWTMEIVNATQPIMESGPPSPPEPDGEAIRAVQARIAAYASPEVKAMIYEQWIPARNEFFDAARYLGVMRKAQEHGRNVETDFKVSVAGQYMKVDDHRKRLDGIVRDIEDRINDELRQ